MKGQLDQGILSQSTRVSGYWDLKYLHTQQFVFWSEFGLSGL